MKLDENKIPRHVAIIMDGNGRWAKIKGQKRSCGHEVGAEAVRKVVKEAGLLKIKYLTLYAFSTENWQRPLSEVEDLMSLLSHYLDTETQELFENNIKLGAIGDLRRLSSDLQELLNSAIEYTSNNKGLHLTLALSYGSRFEIVEAVKKLAQEIKNGTLKPKEITEELITTNLWTKNIPDPDLLIRTGGDFRLSNFLLWQAAYTELYITDCLWPDFDGSKLKDAILIYQNRERRFGSVV